MDNFETLNTVMQLVPYVQKLHAAYVIAKEMPNFTEEEKRCITSTLETIKQKSDYLKRRTLEKDVQNKAETTRL